MSRRRPHVITSAERSPDEQLRTRQIRYASMMGIRALCLVVAGVLVSVDAPMLWLWVPLCVVGMVLLPWMAVIIANDRLPKEQYRFAAYLRGGFHRPAGRQVRETPDRQALAATEQRVIDAEP